MNKKYLKDMLNAVVRLSPAPILIDKDGSRKALADTHWQVTSVGEGTRGQLEVATISQNLGLRLPLFFDRIKEFQNENLYYPSRKQGVFILKCRWEIQREGNLPKCLPV